MRDRVWGPFNERNWGEDRERNRDRGRDRGRGPAHWTQQLDRFLEREELDAEICATIRNEPPSLQRHFVAHGTFEDVRRSNGNCSAVAYSRLKELRSGRRLPRDTKYYNICKWCGQGVLKKESHCDVCSAYMWS